MKRVILFLIFALALCATCSAQTGQTQDAALDSKRVGFAPTVVRHANLAAQDVGTWSGLPGQATVTTGVTAPDGTTTAATFSIASPPTGGKVIYSAQHNLKLGDWLVFGVWVRAVSLTAPITTLESQAVARISAIDPTLGYQFDTDNLNYRDLFATVKADSEWAWVTSAAKVVSAPSTQTATVQFELQCSINKTLSFYAPVLHYIPVGQVTDAEAASLLRNLYSVPDGVPAGNVALLRGQALYCYSAGSYTPCAFGGGGGLGGDPVIEDATPTLEFRDTDAADFIHELNVGVYFMRFVGGPTLLSFTNSTNKVNFLSPVSVRMAGAELSDHVYDTNGNEILKLAPVGSAVNELTVGNNTTGNAPTLSATGDNSDIDLALLAKGTGAVLVTGPTPKLEFRDTDSADFLIDGLTNAISMRFVGSGSMLIFNQSNGRLDSPWLRVNEIDVVNNIRDTNSFPLIIPAPAGTPANQFTIGNANAGSGPTLSATGTDPNIPINVNPKGTGSVFINTASATAVGLSIDHSSANSSGAFLRGRTGGTNRIEVLPFDLGGARVGGWINMSTTGPSGIGSGGVGAAAWIAYADTNGAYFTDSLTSDIAYRSVSNSTRLIFGNDGTTAAALYVSGNLVGVNKGTSIGAQLHVNSGSTSRRAFVANNPSGTTVPIAEFRTNEVAQLTIKSNGFIIGVPKTVNVNGAVTGNVTTGLDNLHSFSLIANSLATNGDYLEVTYSGNFAVNDNNKRIVVSFGGVSVDDTGLFDQDAGNWTYVIRYLRVSSTTVRYSILYTWGLQASDGASSFAGNGRAVAANGLITVADLSANAMTMLLQAEGTSNDDITQNMSIIQLTQNN